jgi:hypothetical protein
MVVAISVFQCESVVFAVRFQFANRDLDFARRASTPDSRLQERICASLANPSSSIYRRFKNPETMALAFSESGHNLKEARLWQE